MRNRLRATLVFLALVLVSAFAAAEEPLTCTADPTAPPVAVSLATPPPAGPRWADVVLAGIVVVVGVVGLLVVRRRRARADAPAVELTPWIAGAGLGVLFALSLLLFNRTVGVSGGFLHVVRGTGTSWPLWVVIGVAGGSFLAALATRSFRIVAVPESWAARHGASTVRRFLVTFVAAALMEVAAAIAGGCTSGLALSGGIGLGVGAFVFMAAMFATGMPAAWLAHGRSRS